MEGFHKVRLEDSEYSHLYIALTSQSIFDVREIEAEAESGKVLLDTFVVNSIKSNRYIEVDLSRSASDFSAYTVVSEVEDRIRVITSKFFKDNPKLVQNSVLSSALKFLIQNDTSFEF